jgi:hypothetical protein
MAANYRKSKAIASLNFRVSQDSQQRAANLLKVHTVRSRQALGEALLDQLADDAGIDICTLKVSATRQYHRRRGNRIVFRQYGYYRPRSRYLYIQNFTAVRGQPLAPRAFAETLLHEWTHHYDTVALELNSIHTSGFYARLKDLKTKLGLVAMRTPSSSPLTIRGRR